VIPWAPAEYKLDISQHTREVSNVIIWASRHISQAMGSLPNNSQDADETNWHPDALALAVSPVQVW
jgi:hypothetical protein